MATIKHLPATAQASEIISEIESNGAVIIDGFLTTEALERFNAEINPLLEKKWVLQLSMSLMTRL